MIKRHRIEIADAQRGLEIFASIPVRYVEVDLVNALSIAAEANIYAYDAYFLECAARCGAPLLTLDRSLRRVASDIGLRLVHLEPKVEVYTYSEARQKLARVLDEAESTGKVLIRRRDGRTYALMPERVDASPLDVPPSKRNFLPKRSSRSSGASADGQEG